MFTDAVLEYELLQSGYECQSSDKKLGTFSTVEGCARACKNMIGCSNFIYGTGYWKKGKCFWEKTSASTCPEGFQKNSYDFYHLLSSGSCVKIYFLLRQKINLNTYPNANLYYHFTYLLCYSITVHIKEVGA